MRRLLHSPAARLSTITRQVCATGLGLIVLPAAAMAQPAGATPVSAAPAATGSGMPNLWDLAVQGGWFMIPIGVASIITMVFTLERLAGLRRSRILPRELIRNLRALISEPTVDPRKLWETCEAHPSPLANAVKASVLKTGRPHPEVEKAVEDAVDRETAEMTRNLRPINVVASISPLLGLLGTVQGMIMAFMVTSTTTSTGTAKAQELAHGIYTALVTTFAGLCVAVVSVVLANFLEGRIERILRQMEAIFLDLLPQLERFEGRIRISESADGDEPGIRVKSMHPSEVAASAAPSRTEPQKSTTRLQPAKKPRATSPPRSVPKEQSAPSAPIPVSADESPREVVAQKQSNPNTLRAHFDQ